MPEVPERVSWLALAVEYLHHQRRREREMRDRERYRERMLHKVWQRVTVTKSRWEGYGLVEGWPGYVLVHRGGPHWKFSPFVAVGEKCECGATAVSPPVNPALRYNFERN